MGASDIINSGGKEGELITLLKNKIKELKKKLMSTKIFLNMVIHEMRNPAISIELALKEALEILSSEGPFNMKPSNT